MAIDLRTDCIEQTKKCRKLLTKNVLNSTYRALGVRKMVGNTDAQSVKIDIRRSANNSNGSKFPRTPDTMCMGTLNMEPCGHCTEWIEHWGVSEGNPKWLNGVRRCVGETNAFAKRKLHCSFGAPEWTFPYMPASNLTQSQCTLHTEAPNSPNFADEAKDTQRQTHTHTHDGLTDPTFGVAHTHEKWSEPNDE